MRAALGDASWMSRARLEYGTTGINPVMCLEGDVDGDGSFTLNDAAWVAEVQFDLARFPWDNEAGSDGEGEVEGEPPSASPSPPPSISPSPPPFTTSNASDHDAYPGCSASDMQGDFNGNGFSSAYIRVHVNAPERLIIAQPHYLLLYA